VPVIRPDEVCVSVYANTEGKLVIAQFPGVDLNLFVVVDPLDASDLCHAIEAVARQIEEAKCRPE